MPLYTYDPMKIITIVGGIPLEGFSDGSKVTIERISDTFTMATGSDNRTTRTKQNDKSGTIKFTLDMSSPSNDYLSGIMLLDETANEGVVPIVVKDLLGTSLYSAAFAWIKKPPAVDYAKETGSREWSFDCADLYMFVGGLNQA